MTNHELVGSYDSRFSDDEAGVDAGATNDFFKCAGCEDPTLRTNSWFSEAPGENTVTFYPPRGFQDNFRTPKVFEGLTYGGPVDAAYRQTISAFNQKLLILAGAGVRLLLEGVCKDRGIIDGEVVNEKGDKRRSKELQGKINGMAEKGLVTSQQAEFLHQIRFIGNDAAHDLDQPTLNHVAMALDIVEHLMEQVYDHPAKAKLLAARQRPKK
jgi:hypothetical protein